MRTSVKLVQSIRFCQDTIVKTQQAGSSGNVFVSCLGVTGSKLVQDTDRPYCCFNKQCVWKVSVHLGYGP
jgi:hypothetical protein